MKILIMDESGFRELEITTPSTPRPCRITVPVFYGPHTYGSRIYTWNGVDRDPNGTRVYVI